MIVELNMHSRKYRKQFLNVAYDLAEEHAHWIPGLRQFHNALFNPIKNPFLQEVTYHFFICKKETKVKGRIAVFGPGYFPERRDIATFGFADFANDTEVSRELLQAAENTARSLGAAGIIGPFNPNIHYDLGVLTAGFESNNSAFMNYNPAYYKKHYENASWHTLKTFHAWQLDKMDFALSDPVKYAEERIANNPDFVFRNIRLHAYQEELKILYDLYCDCFSSHWGFVMPGWNEFKFIAADLRQIIQTQMGMIAEYKGKAVGFVLGVPDINILLRKDKSGYLFPSNWWRLLTKVHKLKTMRVMIAGVLPRFRGTGIYAALFAQFTRTLFSKTNITGGEVSWVMDGNTSMEKILTAFGARQTKEYTLFKKEF